MFCSQCGIKLTDDSICCSKCGTRISTQSQIATPSSKDNSLTPSQPLKQTPQSYGLFSKIKRYMSRGRNGEERLWKIFWLNTILGGYVFVFLFSALTGFVFSGTLYKENVAVFGVLFIIHVLCWILAIYYFVWALRSLWKCAYNTEWKGWGYLARAFVVWSVFSFFLHLWSFLHH